MPSLLAIPAQICRRDSIDFQTGWGFGLFFVVEVSSHGPAKRFASGAYQ
jgi:hypothetical protein